MRVARRERRSAAERGLANEEVGAFIRDQRRVAELSLRRLAELAGVSNPYLSQIERGLRRPSAEILQQIARALEISAESLYVRAGILDTEASTGGMSDLESAIRGSAELTSEQRRALLAVYRSFVTSAGLGREAPDSEPLPSLAVTPLVVATREDSPLGER